MPADSTVGVAGCPFAEHRDHHSSIRQDVTDSTVPSNGCPFMSSLLEARETAQLQSQEQGQQVSCSQEAASGRQAGVYQAWKLQRPVVGQCPRLTRQQLRKRGQHGWAMEEVAQHRFPDDGWVVIDGSVYDITEHVVHHPGWDTGCGISTVISILAALGTDATHDFKAIHPPWSPAWKQLRPFYIGELAPTPSAANAS